MFLQRRNIRVKHPSVTDAHAANELAIEERERETERAFLSNWNQFEIGEKVSIRKWKCIVTHIGVSLHPREAKEGLKKHRNNNDNSKRIFLNNSAFGIQIRLKEKYV